MNYMLDTEFEEDGKTIDLISIAIVAEDGRELYLGSSEFDFTSASKWVRENVFPHLDNIPRSSWLLRKEMEEAILSFLENDKNPVFWGEYADYDWVAMAQIWGRMLDLPEHFPKFCMDLKQLKVMLGNPELPEQTTPEHDALNDARHEMVHLRLCLSHLKARGFETNGGRI